MYFPSYPAYRRGNPQLRVFLPNFWMKLVKPEKESHPANKVQFIVSSQMTRLDVKNYLEKIYQVPVMDVRTLNHMGKTYEDRAAGDIGKEDDYKIAYVTLVIKKKKKKKKGIKTVLFFDIFSFIYFFSAQRFQI